MLRYRSSNLTCLSFETCIVSSIDILSLVRIKEGSRKGREGEKKKKMGKGRKSVRMGKRKREREKGKIKSQHIIKL